MIQQSTEINELTKALVAARKEMNSVGKGATAHYGNYADLNTFIDASIDHLLAHDIMVTQPPVTQFIPSDSNQVPSTLLIGCTTLIMHSSGQWMSSTLLLPCMDLSPQAAGGVITYSRRYSLQAILLLPAKDDDAQAAQTSSKKIQTAAADNGKLVAAYKRSMFTAANGADLETIYKATKDNAKLTPEEKAELHDYATERNQKIKGAQ